MNDESEGTVTNNRILRSARRIVGLILKLTTGRHEASRGLSATLGLLVLKIVLVNRKKERRNAASIVTCSEVTSWWRR